jgi:hypothetical protein
VDGGTRRRHAIIGTAKRKPVLLANRSSVSRLVNVLSVPLDVMALRSIWGSYNKDVGSADREIGLHDGGWPVDDVVAYLERWSLLPHERASKAASFMTDPTWRAYGHCYTEGLRLCRGWVTGDADRFERLVTEQFLPADLAA